MLKKACGFRVNNHETGPQLTSLAYGRFPFLSKRRFRATFVSGVVGLFATSAKGKRSTYK